MLLLAALGCSGRATILDAGGADAAVPDGPPVDPACRDVAEGTSCDPSSTLESTRSCQGGRCLPGCQGDASRTPCTAIWWQGSGCCTLEERCCYVGFLTTACRPAGITCPHVCGEFGRQTWECPAESACLYEFADPGSMPADGTCGRWSAPGDFGFRGGCAALCPAERRCGDACCGRNARCALAESGDACCMASRAVNEDGGAADGG
jgi:hypothetical protein